MFIIRLLGKVLAFPVVVVLMAVLIAVETFEKVIGFFVGLLNVMIVLVILYCLMVIHDYEMVKRACWLFVGEGIFYAVLVLVVGKLEVIKDNLMMFMVL